MANPTGKGGFKKGQSGNPEGRPIGSRCKLELAFLDDCLASWSKHGPESIEAMRQADVSSYCKMLATLLPKHSERTIKHDVANLSDAEIISLVKDVRDNLGTAPSGRGAGEASKDKTQLN